jgi:hypothetical protein
MRILHKSYEGGGGGLLINFSSSIGRAAAVSISCQLLCVCDASGAEEIPGNLVVAPISTTDEAWKLNGSRSLDEMMGRLYVMRQQCNRSHLII